VLEHELESGSAEGDRRLLEGRELEPVALSRSGRRSIARIRLTPRPAGISVAPSERKGDSAVLDDFNRALARVQSDYAFFIDCHIDPAKAFAGYDLSPEERSALSDPEKLSEVLKGRIGVNRARERKTTEADVSGDARVATEVEAIKDASKDQDRGGPVDGSRRLSESETSVRTVWPFDIGIVGTGIVGTHQLTREAEEVIRRCKRTFVIDFGYGIPEYLESLCPHVTELGLFYERGKGRLPTYRRMAAEVVAAAVADAPVCLATYGHPWVYCYPTTLITQAAPLHGLHVEVFPGISSLDTLLVDLGIDIGFSGVQMYEATDLLLRRRPLQTDAACVIWQPTVFGDPTSRREHRAAAQFKPLEEYLLLFYPAEHEAAIVTTKTFPLTRSVVQRLQLGDLAAELERTSQMGTLYIPPLTDRPVEDTALLDVMLSAETEAVAGSSCPAGRNPA
jgi:precorrin-6B methylase 1